MPPPLLRNSYFLALCTMLMSPSNFLSPMSSLVIEKEASLLIFALSHIVKESFRNSWNPIWTDPKLIIT